MSNEVTVPFVKEATIGEGTDHKTYVFNDENNNTTMIVTSYDGIIGVLPVVGSLDQVLEYLTPLGAYELAKGLLTAINDQGIDFKTLENTEVK